MVFNRPKLGALEKNKKNSFMLSKSQSNFDFCLESNKLTATESFEKDSMSYTAQKVIEAEENLETYFKEKLIVDNSLTRQLVSFQASKVQPVYRWYKYKEGFSATLVKKFIQNRDGYSKDKLLDPFAGSGAALFAASELGLESCGIELLPIGQIIISTRKVLEKDFSLIDLERIKYWHEKKPWVDTKEFFPFSSVRITEGAYPDNTSLEIGKYRAELLKENKNVQAVLEFALLCILESISYTRKDGQYLRWDFRSKRTSGSKIFNKGVILNFADAISKKLEDIILDMNLFFRESLDKKRSEINLLEGSCLNILPTLKQNTFDIVFTSPPYCNRYDYTRTYALELAMLGNNDKNICELRQNMLSCTVENKMKDLLSLNPDWAFPLQLAENQECLQLILKYLNEQKEEKLLNNNGIPRMVQGYFYELSCVIYELHRVLKKNGQVFMVNDNVRYSGVTIPVDLIFSKIAEEIGFCIEKILVLPNGKGNSSQQMGLHGRQALRKCVYIWRKK